MLQSKDMNEKGTYIVEALGDGGLVVNHALPEASRLRRLCDREVGLETHFSLGSKRVRDLGVGLTRRGREGLVSVQEDLEEDLSVEGEWGRVEWHCLAIIDEGVRAGN